MGGRVGVESREGEGSIFWFEVSLPASSAEDEAILAAPPAAAGTVRPAKILLVEDLDLNQELARSVLERAGHRVDVAADGAEAVQRPARATDLVLMDIQMPVMDGIAATERIRNLPGEGRFVPIVAMTANVLPAQVSGFRQAGMDDHVGKPFKRDELLRVVERWAGARGGRCAGRRGRAHGDGAGASRGRRLRRRHLQRGHRPRRREEAAGTPRQVRRHPHPLARPGRRRSDGPGGFRRPGPPAVSSAGLVGFEELSDLCRELEEACRQGGPEEALLADVETARRQALTQVTALKQAG